MLSKAHHLGHGQQVEQSSWLLRLVVTAEQRKLGRSMSKTNDVEDLEKLTNSKQIAVFQ